MKEGKKTQHLKRALEEISEHIRNVKKRFGSEVLRKLKFERFNFLKKNIFDIFESDGADIDDMYEEQQQQVEDEQQMDDSSNSSSEKNKMINNEQQRKRPLRNRDSNQLGVNGANETSKLHHDSALFGIPISGNKKIFKKKFN